MRAPAAGTASAPMRAAAGAVATSAMRSPAGAVATPAMRAPAAEAAAYPATVIAASKVSASMVAAAAATEVIGPRLQIASAVVDRRGDGHALASLHHLPGHHEALRLMVEAQRDARRLDGRAFVPRERILHRQCGHPRSLHVGERRIIRLAELLGRPIEQLDGLGWIESRPLKRETVLVDHRQNLFLAVDRGAAFGIVGMERDVGRFVAALDPAPRAQMMPLVARDPDVAMSAMNPAPGVADSPVVRER